MEKQDNRIIDKLMTYMKNMIRAFTLHLRNRVTVERAGYIRGISLHLFDKD